MAQRPQEFAQVADTYRRMATEARYRPAAAAEEMDDVTAPRDQLDLEQEARTTPSDGARRKTTGSSTSGSAKARRDQQRC